MSFEIIRDDLTKVRADAIVNTANPEPVYARGTDLAVYRAAGEKELLRERQKIGRIAPGEAAVTGAFRLPAKYIIHTVGPEWIDGKHGEAEILDSCYRKSLLLADQLGCESIAFPLIATGIYGFPKDLALEIALNAIRRHLEHSELRVTLVVFGRDSYQLAESLVERVEAYIDENYVREQKICEYEGPEAKSSKLSRFRNLFERRRRAKEKPSSSLSAYPDAEALPGEETGATWSGATLDEPEQIDWMEESRPEELDRWENELASTMTFQAVQMPKAPDHAGNLIILPKPSSAPSPKESAPHTASHAAPSVGPKPGESSLYAASSVPMEAQDPWRRRQATLEGVLKNLGESFQTRLLRMIDERGMSDPEVYKRANVDRKLFSKIRCSEDYTPKKKTILALAIALQLNLDETKDLLASAGWMLADNNRSDMIVSFCIENGIYDIFEVNALLFYFEEPILG